MNILSHEYSGVNESWDDALCLPFAKHGTVLDDQTSTPLSRQSKGSCFSSNFKLRFVQMQFYKPKPYFF